MSDEVELSNNLENGINAAIDHELTKNEFQLTDILDLLQIDLANLIDSLVVKFHNSDRNNIVHNYNPVTTYTNAMQYAENIRIKDYPIIDDPYRIEAENEWRKRAKEAKNKLLETPGVINISYVIETNNYDGVIILIEQVEDLIAEYGDLLTIEFRSNDPTAQDLPYKIWPGYKFYIDMRIRPIEKLEP